MSIKDNYEYDVALSYAWEQKDYVKRTAVSLKRNGVKVFFSEFETDNLWGKNVYDFFDEIFRKKSRYCVMFISKDYEKKYWTNHERKSAQARAFKENKEYILPVKFDDTEIPGISETIFYRDANQYTPEELGKLIIEKIRFTNTDNSNVLEGEIVDLTTMCLSFPDNVCGYNSKSSDFISRENVIATIDKIFESGAQVIGIEGEEGIGKTTLLAQYAKMHPDNTFSLFIKFTSRWACDPSILEYDICNQINWFFNKEPIKDPTIVNNAFYRNSILQIQQHSRLYKQKFIFVIDGLENIDEEANETRDIILDMLPFGFSNFNFLISVGVGQDFLAEHRKKGLSYKSFPLVELNYSEVEKYFNDIFLEKKHLDEIYKTCSGIPGKLASIKRILKSGIDINSFINDMYSKVPDLFEIEWNNVISKNSHAIKIILAILSLDDNIHNIDFLAGVLNYSNEDIIKLLKEVSFICIDQSSFEISFVSNGFKKYVANKLSHYKDEVNDLIIKYLLSRPDCEENIKYLPIYLERAGRYNEVIQHLSPDKLDLILQKMQSLNMIEKMVDVGLNSSQKKGNDGNIVRFGLHKSILKELKGAETWRSEVEALMALKDYDSAMALAQYTVLKEDRLHLLAIIAKKKQEHGLAPEPELIEQIKDLYKQIDVWELDENLIDIASDLLCTVPEIAVELIEKSNNSINDNDSLDWAFARLSLAAITSSKKLRESDVFENIYSKITNPLARQFSTGADLLLGKYSPKKVITEVEKLENISDRLYFLCKWVKVNRRKKDTFNVVDYALNLILKTTSYAPNAKIFRDLASSLSFIEDEEKARYIISILDSQKQTIEHSGPTEDYVVLQLLLAEAESKYDFTSSGNRLCELYLYLDYTINDFDSKINCLARYICTLENIDKEKLLEATDGLHSLANKKFENALEILLNSSAAHYELTKSIIYNLARYKPNKAFNLACSLNTQDRRDLAFDMLIESYVKLPLKDIEFKFLKHTLDRILNYNIKSNSLLKIIKRIANDSKITDEILDASLVIINEIDNINTTSEKCRACCLIYITLKENKIVNREHLERYLLELLKTSWEKIDTLWQKINVGFKIVEAMAEYSPDIAKEYYDLTNALKNNIIFDTRLSALTYITCIKLAARAYSGLLPKRIHKDNDLIKLAELIHFVPSVTVKLELWSDIAFYYDLNNLVSEFHKIYDVYIKPLLESVSEKHEQSSRKILTNIAPLIYKAHKPTAFSIISSLPLPDKDYAYFNICDYLVYKKVPIDPYEEFDDVKNVLKYTVLLDVCEILELIESDIIMYHIISNIAECVRQNKAMLTREQKNEIIRKLVKIVQSKLPNERYIKHNGYKIISLAQIYTITKVETEKWNELINEAYNIPNTADKAFVLCVIANVMSHSSLNVRKKLIENARDIIKKIPSKIEMIDHMEMLADSAWYIDSSICKDSLKNALKLSLNCNNNSIFRTQRNIIDLAYRLDKDLAASLTSMVDDDKTRALMRGNIKHHYNLLKLKKAISDPNSTDLSDNIKAIDYVDTCWMLLKSLNSGRISSKNIGQTIEYIIKTCELPLIKTYPVFAWVIQNANIRLAQTDQAVSVLRSIFESTLLAADFVKRVVLRKSKLQEQTIISLSKHSTVASLQIRPGDRENAIVYIRNWMENNLKNYLKICDPCFGLDELSILKHINSINPNCRVYIITSINYLNQKNIQEPWRDTYRNFWRMKISDQDPPDTEIIVIGTQSQNTSPIHDRWLITESNGLRLGVSFNELGVNKSCLITVLSENEAQNVNKELDQYVNRSRREYNGERLEYTVITLL